MSGRELAFVSVDWLHEYLTDPHVSVIDATWYLPNDPRSSEEDYFSEHIPGAFWFDIDSISDQSQDLPHMLPSPEVFAKHMGDAGVSHAHTIVVYDRDGLFSAGRVWWTFKVMGASQVYILEGGLDAWKDAGFLTSNMPAMKQPVSFETQFNADAVASIEDILAYIQDQGMQIIDARPAGRFSGDAPEPRPELQSGHMQDAINIPFSDLLNNGILKDDAGLWEVFEKAGVDFKKPVTVTCGSGVTAALLYLALFVLGYKDAKLYDGSWSEWALSGNKICKL